MNATLNHAPRKQLSSQLDRLDNILDGLSDALPQVVADAIQQATKAAVQAAIAEILANPKMLQALQEQQQDTPTPTPATPSPTTATPPSTPATPPKPSLWSRVTGGLWKSVSWVGQQCRRVGGFLARTVSAIARATVACARLFSSPFVYAAMAIGELAFSARRSWSFSPN